MAQLTRTEFSELSAICPDGLFRDVELSALSQWRIGGKADLIVRPSSTSEVSALIRWFSERGIKPVVIGLTSNLLFDDAGLRAPCIQVGSRMARMLLKGQQVRVQAGIWVPRLARNLLKVGLSGAEHICGIPGTLGGLICMNGGSQRKGIGTHVTEVVSVDYQGNIRRRTQPECDFGYRTSIFQNNGEIIVQATLSLSRASDPLALRREMVGILASRRLKFPKHLPNCGSVFVSNPDNYEKFGPPGAVIEQLGFKGKAVGGAMVSPQHANFIVNRGGARAQEILALILEISDCALQELGLTLHSEVRYVRPDGQVVPATDVPPSALLAQ